MHRQAFHHYPVKPRRRNLIFARGNRLARPNFAIGDLAQRVDDADSTGLRNLGQRHLVKRTKPAPAFDHQTDSCGGGIRGIISTA